MEPRHRRRRLLPPPLLPRIDHLHHPPRLPLAP